MTQPIAPQTAQYEFKSALGPLYLVASPQGLQALLWRKPAGIPQATPRSPAWPVIEQTIRELSEYFAGERRKFTVLLDPRAGTPFQQRVWRELKRIPYGQTLSYGELATQIQKPRAHRAVGTANGRNPLCIIVPCHRVIATGGGLGGYAGGLNAKRRLLELELKQQAKA